ncbi:hypothetical protein BJ742DRAFT_673003 [Cladochytrium replicatum]|nr:hypothetical protein BJ742DRAFT_673003 [Cladochytrium replicatum]
MQQRHYKIEVPEAKKGQVLRIKGGLWEVFDKSHTSQGRGGAHYKLDLKDIRTGSKASERFNPSNILEGVDLEAKQYQFLYADENLHLLEPQTFEELEISFALLTAPKDKVMPFLKSDTMIKVLYDESDPVVAHLPNDATYTVTITDPPPSSTSNEGKGTLYKNAVLDTGVTISVPEHVQVGETVVVDLSTLKYVSKCKRNQ